jgi:hypothetical protein
MLATNSPMPSGANSQSESLGASISDLSSEATSEFSNDNYSIVNQNSKQTISKPSNNLKNGSNTNNNGNNNNNNNNNNTSNSNGSRLPIFKKTK